jgi:hypothetical protein
VTIDLLKTAVGELQAAAGKLGRELQRMEEDPPAVVGAKALVRLDDVRRDIEALGKKLTAASGKPRPLTANGKPR